MRTGSVARRTRSNGWWWRAASPEWLARQSGLIYVPVEHEGCVYESVEEEDRIAAVVRDLLELKLRTKKGRSGRSRRTTFSWSRPITCRFGGWGSGCAVRVGTVDKFQGQEAAVVIFSMCASSGDACAARRSNSYSSRNRLNVAISRAETLAIVVANPALVRTRCTSIEQMGLVNVYCRAVWKALRSGAGGRGPGARGRGPGARGRGPGGGRGPGAGAGGGGQGPGAGEPGAGGRQGAMR